jgi:SHS2 domain-containing protein
VVCGQLLGCNRGSPSGALPSAKVAYKSYMAHVFMKNCKILSHTADIRVDITAQTIEKLFINAASCLFGLLTDIKIKPKITREVQLEAQNLEELLVFWLNELVSVFYSFKFLPCSYKIIIEDSEGLKVLKAKIKGADFDPYNNKHMKLEIKAATYHNLKIEKNKKSFEAQVIFDV